MIQLAANINIEGPKRHASRVTGLNRILPLILSATTHATGVAAPGSQRHYAITAGRALPGTLFWILVVVGFLYWAPVVSCLNLVVLAVIVAFINTEGSTWHHAQEFENRFWTVISFIGTTIFTFSPDCPLALGRWSPFLGWFVVFTVTIFVHMYDRHLHRINISRKPEFYRARQAATKTPVSGRITPSSARNTQLKRRPPSSDLSASYNSPHARPMSAHSASRCQSISVSDPSSNPETDRPPIRSAEGSHPRSVSFSLPGPHIAYSNGTPNSNRAANNSHIDAEGLLATDLPTPFPGQVTAEDPGALLRPSTTRHTSKLLSLVLATFEDGPLPDQVAQASIEEKLRLIEDILGEVDLQFIPSTVTSWFSLQRVLRLERAIINIFTTVRTEELCSLVSHVSLGLVFYKMKDHYLGGNKYCFNRTNFIEILAVTRISELGVPERAVVLDALQQMKLTAHRRADTWVRNILLSTLDDNLSELKSLMDVKGDFQSLHKLVFDDIRSECMRREVLNHIKKQASIQAAHMRLGTKLARQRRKRQPWRKILSDVDDTLSSSGGRFPAGIDRRLPRHAIYPGVLAFYRELDLGTEGPDEWAPDRDQGNLVFLSARPHVYKDVSEKHSYAKFRLMQEQRGMHTTPTLLAGSLGSGYAYLVARNIEGLAQKKLENFEQFVSLYPEYTFVFIGDNGQGDLRVAEMMAERAKAYSDHPCLDAVYIHRIQPLTRSHGYNDTAFDRWRECGIYFFDDYIDAALDAATRRQPPLIRMTGLRRVVEAAVDDFWKIDDWQSPRDQEARRIDLNRSLRRSNDVLVKNGLEPVPHILPASTPRFAAGARVITLYGVGLIQRYRPEDGVYEVLLDWSATSQASSQVTNRPKEDGDPRETRVGAAPPSPLMLPSPLRTPSQRNFTESPRRRKNSFSTEVFTTPTNRQGPGPFPDLPETPKASTPRPNSATRSREKVPSQRPVAAPHGAQLPFAAFSSTTTTCAFLQDSAILTSISSASKGTTVATQSSAGSLSSYISFFPGASYLTRLRGDRPKYAVGTQVITPMGSGSVIKHRPVEAPRPAGPPTPTGNLSGRRAERLSSPAQALRPESYVVKLKWGATGYFTASTISSPPPSSPGPSSHSKSLKVTTDAAVLNAEGPQGGLAGTLLSWMKLGSARHLGSGGDKGGGQQVILASGMIVNTRFGQALVKERREKDHVTVLELPWHATAYVPVSRLAEFCTPGSAVKAGRTGQLVVTTEPKQLSPASTQHHRQTAQGSTPSGAHSILGFFKTSHSTATGSETPRKGKNTGEKNAREKDGRHKAPDDKEGQMSDAVLSGHDRAGSPGTKKGEVIREESRRLSGDGSEGRGWMSGWWSKGGSNGFNKGDRVRVDSFGEAVVLGTREREKRQIVEVAFSKWKARGYVRREAVHLCESTEVPQRHLPVG